MTGLVGRPCISSIGLDVERHPQERPRFPEYLRSLLKKRQTHIAHEPRHFRPQFVSNKWRQANQTQTLRNRQKVARRRPSRRQWLFLRGLSFLVPSNQANNCRGPPLVVVRQYAERPPLVDWLRRGSRRPQPACKWP